MDTDDDIEIVYDTLDCEIFLRRKEEFSASLEEEFKTILKSAEEQNNFEWRHLEGYYNNLKRESRYLYTLQIFCEFSFRLFLKFNCYDTDLMIKFISMYQQVRTAYEALRLCECSKHLESMRAKHHFNEDFFSIEINESEESTRFSRKFYSQLTFSAISFGDIYCLQFLNKYNFNFFPDEMDDTKDELRKLYSLSLMQQVSSLNMNFLSAIFSPLNRIGTDAHRDDFVGSILEPYSTNGDHQNLRRLTLIVMAVNLSLKRALRHKMYDSAECLKFHAMTLPEAPITVKEVKDFLDLVLENAVFVEQIFTCFMRAFPETPSYSSPRPLKHLCRYKVRHSIQKCLPLTNILLEMQIPNPIKDYLLYLSN